MEPSDEEVLSFDEEDDGTDKVSESADGYRSTSEAEGRVQDWGTSRADYYDADVIETEADALEEEAEARRLQQKQMQNMNEADFGFEKSEWAHAENEQDTGYDIVVEKLPDVAVTEDTPVLERLKLLKSRYPELDPLARDYAALHVLLDELKLATDNASTSTKQPSKKRKAEQDERTIPVSVPLVKWTALSTYLGTIAMYFALLTAPAIGKSGSVAPMPPAELRQHPVMQSLLMARHSWDSVKDFEVPDVQVAGEESDVDLEMIPPKIQVFKDLEPALAPTALFVSKREKKSKVSNRPKDDIKELSKKTKRARKGTKAGGFLDQLDNLITSVKNTSQSQVERTFNDEEELEFGDEVALTAQEAAEKAQRKKSLRFYTSQLSQKSNKRDAASREAGGDADLPHKERLKDRQARLMREAEKRGGEKAQLEQRLDYQDEDEDEEETERVAKKIRGDDSDSEDYYQVISKKVKAKKGDKAARAAAHAEAAKIGGQVYVEDTVGEDGKRSITYEISKNKGLMPRRKKEVRNPRVKKRMKYDQKLKKLGSIRQVYKGGEGKGGYGGELSGIKTNIVRSVKL